MLSTIASLMWLVAGVAVATYFLMRWSKSAARVESVQKASLWELDRKLTALQGLIALARLESRRLEAAIAKAEALERLVPGRTLVAIEDLGDAAALENPQALEEVAAQIPRLPRGMAGDVFEADEKALKIVRLLDQGHSMPEIARRLGLSVGEVELRLSTRS